MNFKLVSFVAACILSTTTFAANGSVSWSYTGDTGPAHWGKLAKAYELCGNGHRQSPIDIKGDFHHADKNLSVDYHPDTMRIIEDGPTDLILDHQRTIIYDGHSIQLNFPRHKSIETIAYLGKTFPLLQFHFHTPSENQLQAQDFPAEIHFVHQTAQGDTAVIGVFIKEGEANPVLQKIIDHFPTTPGKEKVVKNEKINPDNLLPSDKTFYSFDGSLTTPPCTQGLHWIVMASPISASKEQIESLKKMAPDGHNARPLQKIADRKIELTKNG